MDFYKSTSHGPSGLFYPQTYHTGEGKNSWTNWELSRITKPTSRTHRNVVPLPKFMKEELVGKGRLTGKVDGAFAYPDSFLIRRGLPGHHMARTEMLSVPFEVELQ